jgi:hypothetical protein
MDENDLLKTRGEHSVTMRRFLIEQEGKQIKELITFAIALMSIFGIMAGLGFTAFQYIKVAPLFFIGEFLVIGSIFYLGFRIKNLLVSWATETSNQIFDYANDAAKIKEAVLKQDAEAKKKLASEFEEAVKDTSTGPRTIRAQAVDAILQKTFWIALIGIVCVLISFIYLPIRHTSWRHVQTQQSDQRGF